MTDIAIRNAGVADFTAIVAINLDEARQTSAMDNGARQVLLQPIAPEPQA